MRLILRCALLGPVHTQSFQHQPNIRAGVKRPHSSLSNMDQTTESQRQSGSGSASKRKKPQRTPANLSKPPQRLILHPPKLPQQPKLVLRSSKQSLSNRTTGDWTDFSLVGSGSRASYNYGDICTVQAVMKIFNGLSSAPSIIDDVEGKHEDVAMSIESKTDDRTRAELEMVCLIL